ncbi:GvpL/GvpF family gas vesicle protein, partial [Aeromonas diversa]|uniref:GvpL/GvpF family gas vesicle protein n=1 Tax=Aeromonas diversa TaxID=502790 RepID=UPI0039A3ED0A
DRVAAHAEAIETVGNNTTLLGADGATETDDEFETVVQLSVLAPEGSEGPIGEILEEFLDGGFDVRYTGPWPPYSHAPM